MLRYGSHFTDGETEVQKIRDPRSQAEYEPGSLGPESMLFAGPPPHACSALCGHFLASVASSWICHVTDPLPQALIKT